MSYQYGPQQPPPRYGQPWPPPRKKSRAPSFFLVLGLVLVTGFGCYSVGSSGRASSGVTATATVTATVTVTARRPKPKPTRGVKATRTAEPTRRPTRQPTRAPRPTHRASVESGVHPGSFCSPQGALGRTDAGTLMRCTSKAGDRARWRSA